MQLVQDVSRWRDRWDRFEATVGLVAAFVLAYGPLTVAAFTLIFSLILAEWTVAGVAAIITLITCPMAVWLTRMAESALIEFRLGATTRLEFAFLSARVTSTQRHRRPSFAMLLASKLPPLPRYARAPLALWWLAHFAAGVALVECGDALARAGLLWNGFTEGIPALVFGYLFHFAANVFLVLAVAAYFESPTITADVWRRRFTIDALFTVPLLVRMLF